MQLVSCKSVMPSAWAVRARPHLRGPIPVNTATFTTPSLQTMYESYRMYHRLVICFIRRWLTFIP